MIDKGINKICRARLCPMCQTDMEEEYVLRCMQRMRNDLHCERCGRVSVTMSYLYTMSKRGFDKHKIPY